MNFLERVYLIKNLFLQEEAIRILLTKLLVIRKAFQDFGGIRFLTGFKRKVYLKGVGLEF